MKYRPELDFVLKDISLSIVSRYKLPSWRVFINLAVET